MSAAGFDSGDRKVSGADRCSRRKFCSIAGGITALALIRPHEALADINTLLCSDLSIARQAICSAEIQLQQILDQIQAAGFPFEDPSPPMSPSEIAQLKQDVVDIVVPLANHLSGYSRDTLEQLSDPAFAGLVEQARAYDVPLIAASSEISTAILAPMSVGATTFNSAGYVILGIVLTALTGLGLDELSSLTKSLEKVIGSVEKLTKAISKGQWSRAGKLLRGIINRISRALKKLGGKAAKKALSSIGAKTVPILGTLILAISLGIAIYENWDKLKEHL